MSGKINLDELPTDFIREAFPSLFNKNNSRRSVELTGREKKLRAVGHMLILLSSFPPTDQRQILRMVSENLDTATKRFWRDRAQSSPKTTRRSHSASS